MRTGKTMGTEKKGWSKEEEIKKWFWELTKWDDGNRQERVKELPGSKSGCQTKPHLQCLEWLGLARDLFWFGTCLYTVLFYSLVPHSLCSLVAFSSTSSLYSESSMRAGTLLAHLLQNTWLWDNAWHAPHFQYRCMQTIWMDSVLTCCPSNAWVKVPWNLGFRDVGTEKRGCAEERRVKRTRRVKTRSKLPSKI